MANRASTDSGCTVPYHCRVFVAQSILRFRWSIEAGRGLTLVRACIHCALVADYLISTVCKAGKDVDLTLHREPEG